MRHLLVLSLLVLASGVSLADERPNFVLCMADDQGWGDVGFNGHPHLQTPIMDEMAATGLRFDHFYAAHPVCSPTRASVMTGRHPNRIGVFSWGHTLRPQEVTIAEVLRQAGYATGHFGKWHLGSVREDSPVNPGNSGFDEWFSSPNFYENSPLLSHRGTVVETNGESSMVTVDLAIPFIEKANQAGTPFLAVIWFGNPHTPHEAQDHLKKIYSGLSEEEQNYYGEMTGIDQAMGKLREELDRIGVRDNTLLWYTSDNGQQGRTVGSSGGLKGAKGSLWEGGIRVPAMIEWPDRVTKNRIVNVRGNTSDIYPTLLDLANVSSPHNYPLDGISLVDVIDDKQNSRGKEMAFWVYVERLTANGSTRAKGVGTPSAAWMKTLQDEQTGKIPATPAPPLSPTALVQEKYEYADVGGHSALIDGDWKLHAIPNKKGKLHYELYNLATDDQETNDVSKDHSKIVKDLASKLTSWRESVIDSLNGKDYSSN